MSVPNVFIAILRQPWMHRPKEMRSDPFWEMGSFGITGCHRRNLLHPRKATRLLGGRIAFAQGGPAGFRLVLLTPPVSAVNRHKRILEIRWEPTVMPFRYDAAPVLIDKSGHHDGFPAIFDLLKPVKRRTWVASFASLFRSRSRPLAPPVSAEIIHTFDRLLAEADPASLASGYVDALPHPPPKEDCNREATYQRLSRRANAGVC
jgi:hypothetical protein